MRILPVMMLALLATGTCAIAQQKDTQTDWQDVEKTLGRAGEEKDGVYRVTFPRNDFRVVSGEIRVEPGLALTSWAGFQQTEKGTMVMGDLVLLPDEVYHVVTKLTEAGFEITAIHNHLMWETPRVMYVHYHANGDAGILAAKLRSVLALTRTFAELNAHGIKGPPPPPDAAQISKILGLEGATRGPVVSFSIPRAEKIFARGTVLRPRMGVATAINFQGTARRAATTGDFVLVASEIQEVIQVLRQHGIAVTALHNHMLDEQPRLFFLHFWGEGNLAKLAEGLRAALDKTNHAK